MAQLNAAGCVTVFREKITGTHAERPQLKRLMAALSHGDVVVIQAVDRLSRDKTDLLVIEPPWVCWRFPLPKWMES